MSIRSGIGLSELRVVMKLLTSILKHPATDNILGLVVMTLDKHDQAVFVNIVGTIDLKKIGKLGAKFDIPSLDKIDKE